MKLVRDVDTAVALLKDEKLVGFDLETSGLSPFRDRIAVVTLYGPESDVAAILHVLGRLPKNLIEFFEVPGREIVGHNILNFDLPYLHTHGVNVFNGQKYFDTLIASTVATITGRRDVKQKLDIVLERELKVKIDKSIVDHRSWMNPTLDENQVTYCLGDIVHLPNLRNRLIEKIRDNKQEPHLWLEMAIIPAFLRMIVNGVPIDREAFIKYLGDNAKLAELYGSKITEILGDINLNSPAQVGAALQKLGIEVTSVSRDALKEELYGLMPTDDENIIDISSGDFVGKMQALTHETIQDMHPQDKKYLVLNLLLAFRLSEQRVKMYRDTFVEPATFRTLKSGEVRVQKEERVIQGWYDKYVTDNFVHCSYWPVSTDTGRTSSNNPNFQQIPNDMRWIYKAPKGKKIVAVDYSQIEVYAMALIAKDAKMLEYLQTGDMHSKLAIDAFGLKVSDIKEVKKNFPHLRKKAKAMVFALLFGGGAKRLYSYIRSQGGQISLDEAYTLVRTFYRLFPGFYEFRTYAFDRVNNSDVIKLRLPTGLVRLLVGDSHKPTTYMNTMIQGSAAGGLKWALKLIVEAGLDRYLAAVVHDEIVMVVPEEEAEFYAKRIAELMVEGMVEVLSRARPNAPEAGIHAEATIADYWSKE